MIKIDELRVGNWLQCKDDNKTKFAIRDGEDIDDIVRFQSYEPIPLTVEIMDKCKHFGKTAKDNEPSYFNGDNIMIRIADWSLFLHSEVNGNVHWMKRLKSLHDLQNTFYAIEGHDMEINW